VVWPVASNEIGHIPWAHAPVIFWPHLDNQGATLSGHDRELLSVLWARGGPSVSRVAHDCSRGSSNATSPSKGAWCIEARLGRALSGAIQGPSLGRREL
jgi:hypothetical protein